MNNIQKRFSSDGSIEKLSRRFDVLAMSIEELDVRLNEHITWIHKCLSRTWKASAAIFGITAPVVLGWALVKLFGE